MTPVAIHQGRFAIAPRWKLPVKIARQVALPQGLAIAANQRTLLNMKKKT